MNTLRSLLMVLILAGIFFFFFYNLTNPKKEHAILKDLEEKGSFMTQPDSVRDKIALNNLVYNISTLENLESGYVGFAGRKSTQPDYLSILKKWATTNQLVELTDYGNALVRSMAFQALADKNYNGLNEIFKKHLNDKQTYNLYSGCTIMPIPVNIAFYRSLYPTINSTEASMYKKELLKQYRRTYLELIGIQL